MALANLTQHIAYGLYQSKMHGYGSSHHHRYCYQQYHYATVIGIGVSLTNTLEHGWQAAAEILFTVVP